MAESERVSSDPKNLLVNASVGMWFWITLLFIMEHICLRAFFYQPSWLYCFIQLRHVYSLKTLTMQSDSFIFIRVRIRTSCFLRDAAFFV
jgi:hypothetical protein